MSLSSCIDNARMRMNNMYKQTNLPDNMVSSVGISGVASFAVTALLSGDVRIGLLFGGLAATASLIHGLTRPLFKKILGTNSIEWYKEAIVMIVNLAITQTLINSLTIYRVNLIASSLLTVALSLLVNQQKTYSLDKNSIYLMI